MESLDDKSFDEKELTNNEIETNQIRKISRGGIITSMKILKNNVL